MATVSFIHYSSQSAGTLKKATDYVTRDDKTLGKLYVSGQNCTPQLACPEFIATREAHRKQSPVWFYHYVQSFSPDEPITGEQAHELAKTLAAQAWPESEVLIATHVDREHIHSHFIVNAVCFERGKMLRQGPTTLDHLRELSDSLCVEQGFSVLPAQQKQQKSSDMGTREYRSAVKGESWKLRLMSDIDACMRYAGSREEFVFLMRQRKYDVRWTENRKNITYVTPMGMQCRDERLHEPKYLKEAMEHEFQLRTALVAGGVEAAEQRRDDAGAGYGTASHGDGEELAGGRSSAPEHSAGTGFAADGGRSAGLSESVYQHLLGSSEPDGGYRAGIPQTGWEAERGVFLRLQQSLQRGAGECEVHWQRGMEFASGFDYRDPEELEGYAGWGEAPAQDQYDHQHDLGDAVGGLVYGLASLERSMNRPVQDATTMRKPRRDVKNRKPRQHYEPEEEDTGMRMG